MCNVGASGASSGTTITSVGIGANSLQCSSMTSGGGNTLAWAKAQAIVGLNILGSSPDTSAIIGCDPLAIKTQSGVGECPVSYETDDPPLSGIAPSPIDGQLSTTLPSDQN